MIHNVYYKMVEECLIYFGNIYFPVRQIKHFFFFFFALERIGFKWSGKFIYEQHFILDNGR